MIFLLEIYYKINVKVKDHTVQLFSYYILKTWPMNRAKAKSGLQSFQNFGIILALF